MKIIASTLLGIWAAACGTERSGGTPSGPPEAPVAREGAEVRDVSNVLNAVNATNAVTSALTEAEVLDRVRGYATTWTDGVNKDALVQPEPDRAPFDCRAPSWRVAPNPSEAKTDDLGHGHKLYYLYAKDVHAYRAQSGLVLDYVGFERVDPGPPVTAQPVGQVIVKEAWTDIAVAEGDLAPARPKALPERATDRTWIDGKAHRIGDKAALFAMVKVADHEVPGSDAGWVYATLTPDGATVTSLGTLPTCMRCHTRAPSDRLFGVKRD
jgi:hypothetical protein